MDLKLLRSQLSIISQRPCLFEGTLAENISPRKISPNETQKIIDQLIELGFSEEKLLPKGLDFELLIDGSNLSQGEKQMISLVIAIYNKTKILIMDEATSNLDQESEKKF